MLFSYDLTGSSYQPLRSFEIQTGVEPYGAVLAHNKFLYGLTFYGGRDYQGVIFSYDTFSDDYEVLRSFAVNRLYLADDADFKISNLSVKNSWSRQIVQDSGHLHLSDMLFSGNHRRSIDSDGGDLTIENSVFDRNHLLSDYGGPIYIDGGDNLWIYDSTFSNNYSLNGYGSVIYTYGYENMEIYNSSFYNNVNEDGDGVIFYEGSGEDSIISNSTFYNNSSNYGGAIYNDGDPINIVNSTFYGNTVEGSGADLYSGSYIIANTIIASDPDNSCTSIYTTSLGGNIDLGDSCGFDHETDLINTDPLLDPDGIKDNGGPVYTIALMSNSPAIDAGIDDYAPETDARGFARFGISDIGAFELQPSDEESGEAGDEEESGEEESAADNGGDNSEEKRSQSTLRMGRDRDTSPATRFFNGSRELLAAAGQKFFHPPPPINEPEPRAPSLLQQIQK